MSSDDPAPTFGLPACMRVPIAAASAEVLFARVGRPVSVVEAGAGLAAVKIEAHSHGIPGNSVAKLWQSESAARFAEILFPKFQYWVHVDYDGYRSTYAHFGFPPIPSETFLDHIQNRRAMRLRWYSHPYLRLSPVSRTTNSNSGNAFGGEGMEVEFLEGILANPEQAAALKAEVFAYKLQYADPADLTKMLDVSPGTFVLNGVRDTQHFFYPANE